MRAPTPARLLQVWERGCDRPGATRALLLLEAANEDADADTLAALPVGRRDAMLIELHARLFREQIVGLARCPECQIEVEAAFACEDLLAAADPTGDDPAGDDPALPPANTAHALDIDGAIVRFRLPDSRDMLALHDHMQNQLHDHLHDGLRDGARDSRDDAQRSRDLLLARCLLTIERDGETQTVDTLSETQIDTLAAAMAAADPLADLRLGFACPACGATWEAGFDPVHFLWQELQHWALRTLRDIDLIARVYHWREADILALAPRRRRAYLELCGS